MGQSQKEVVARRGAKWREAKADGQGGVLGGEEEDEGKGRSTTVDPLINRCKGFPRQVRKTFTLQQEDHPSSNRLYHHSSGYTYTKFVIRITKGMSDAKMLVIISRKLISNTSMYWYFAGCKKGFNSCSTHGWKTKKQQVHRYDFNHFGWAFQLQVYNNTQREPNGNNQDDFHQHFALWTLPKTKKKLLHVNWVLFTLFRPEVVRFQKFQQLL
jgi:hypothetical protein